MPPMKRFGAAARRAPAHKFTRANDFMALTAPLRNFFAASLQAGRVPEEPRDP
jgi:hypothetical protein